MYQRIPAKRARCNSLPSSLATSIGPDVDTSSLPPPSVFVHASSPKVHSLPHQIIDLPSGFFIWDLRDDPSMTSLPESYASFVLPVSFTQPATEPLTSFSLAIIIPSLPWAIKVYLSNRLYITLKDVFDSVYGELRKNITDSEFSILPEDHQHCAVQAYLQRCARHGNGAEERKSGMKLVDFLMGNTEFLGLFQHRPNEWQLNIGPANPLNSESSGYLQAPLLPRSINLRTPGSQDPTASNTTPLPPPTNRKTSPSSTSDVEEAPKHLRPASFEKSAHMFEHAHNVIISDGEFYNAAGGMNINNSHSIDASIHPTNITHLWQYQHASNQILLSPNIGEGQAWQIEGRGTDSELFLGEKSRFAEGGTCHEKKRHPGHIMLSSLFEAECPHLVIDCATRLDESELENHQYGEAITITSRSASYAHESLTDEVVYDILFNYSPPPIGNFYLFNRMVKALLVAFSPLSPAMIAALFNFDDVRHVKQILLLAHPLLFVPDYDEQSPVRFIHPSIAEFFLDRTRSGKYFVDPPTAHRVLLDRSTSMMMRVHEAGQALDNIGRGWRDAYEYSCRNWEAHRRAATRSKL